MSDSRAAPPLPTLQPGRGGGDYGPTGRSFAADAERLAAGVLAAGLGPHDEVVLVYQVTLDGEPAPPHRASLTHVSRGVCPWSRTDPAELAAFLRRWVGTWHPCPHQLRPHEMLVVTGWSLEFARNAGPAPSVVPSAGGTPLR
jgi:hypothetical protein